MSRASGKRRVTGIRLARSSSSGACSDSASFTCSGSAASRSMPGTQPAVEMAMWRAPSAYPAGSAIVRQASSTAS